MVHNSWSLIKKLPYPVSGYISNTPGRPIEDGRRSPKCWRKVELDGVGLGIVAALERASGTEATAATPIAIVSPRAAKGHRWRPEAAGAELGGDRTICCTDTHENEAAEEAHKFQAAEFLNRCQLCRARLHGKDIYIYRGEKAFCSEECRYQQIINDEYQEKRCLDVPAAQTEISSSPCSVGGSRRLFFTGILVS